MDTYCCKKNASNRLCTSLEEAIILLTERHVDIIASFRILYQLLFRTQRLTHSQKESSDLHVIRITSNSSGILLGKTNNQKESSDLQVIRITSNSYVVSSHPLVRPFQSKARSQGMNDIMDAVPRCVPFLDPCDALHTKDRRQK